MFVPRYKPRRPRPSEVCSWHSSSSAEEREETRQARKRGKTRGGHRKIILEGVEGGLKNEETREDTVISLDAVERRRYERGEGTDGVQGWVGGCKAPSRGKRPRASHPVARASGRNGAARLKRPWNYPPVNTYLIKIGTF